MCLLTGPYVKRVGFFLFFTFFKVLFNPPNYEFKFYFYEGEQYSMTRTHKLHRGPFIERYKGQKDNNLLEQSMSFL